MDVVTQKHAGGVEGERAIVRIVSLVYLCVKKKHLT